ncbi:MAG: hypothetical protein E7137_00915 [Rikenellaceae bacterium]|nr:hypothetical protein [Rikenellaceae bacterium]
MSIRLWSDGHSFPREQLEAAKSGGGLSVELLSPRTTLVPAPHFRPEEAAELLRLAGLPCRESECAVWSDPEEEVVAVMAIDRATHDLLPPQTLFTSPLLAQNPGVENIALLSRYENLLYIKIWERTLRLAEVLKVENDEDLIYFLTRLGEVIPLGEYSLVVAGDEPQKLRKLVKKLFK